jgi:hypothetical protein
MMSSMGGENGNEFTQVLKDTSWAAVSNPRPYDRNDPGSDRIKSLRSRFIQILKNEANLWWTDVLNRACMARFYADFSSEVDKRYTRA